MKTSAENKSNQPPSFPPNTQLIYSQQVSPGIQQNMLSNRKWKKNHFFPKEEEESHHIPKRQEICSSGFKPSSGNYCPSGTKPSCSWVQPSCNGRKKAPCALMPTRTVFHKYPNFCWWTEGKEPKQCLQNTETQRTSANSYRWPQYLPCCNWVCDTRSWLKMSCLPSAIIVMIAVFLQCLATKGTVQAFPNLTYSWPLLSSRLFFVERNYVLSRLQRSASRSLIQGHQLHYEEGHSH